MISSFKKLIPSSGMGNSTYTEWGWSSSERASSSACFVRTTRRSGRDCRNSGVVRAFMDYFEKRRCRKKATSTSDPKSMTAWIAMLLFCTLFPPLTNFRLGSSSYKGILREPQANHAAALRPEEATAGERTAGDITANNNNRRDALRGVEGRRRRCRRHL